MRLILLGFGTVGQGLAELLLAKKTSLSRDYGFKPVVVGIADMQKGSIANPKGIDLKRALELAKKGKSLTALPGREIEGDALAFIKAVAADALVEATYTDIKTGQPATSYVEAALKKKLHVTTTNKGPVALHYRKLKRLADRQGVQFLFEGTVVSGTPLVNLIRDTLAGSEIREIRGILNGTTNYILTRMEEGLGYEAALKKAQELGYAEAVPDADVLGWDALAKVTILANVFFQGTKKPFDYSCRGITKIDATKIEAAKRAGKRYKLIGRIWRQKGEVKASVGPQQVDLSHPLAGVGGATNAVTVSTDTLGDVTIVGPGAGRVETGYSLLADLIHIHISTSR
jgi:homoserine dehydrogenase